ncbi:MAG TPA: phosphate acyltransferase, partial [Ignavibacteriaceae bacterium]|nr:phosphate acyltransferase [Ignavibacteriaceae bacterium]
MNLIDTCKLKIKGNPKRVVFPDSKDERVLKAARYLADESLAVPILIGGPFEIRDFADEYRISTKGIDINSPTQCPDIKSFASTFYELRKHKGMTLEEAEKLILDPVNYAAMLVRKNSADICIAGNLSTT